MAADRNRARWLTGEALRRAEDPVRRAWRRTVVARGDDVTRHVAQRSALVLAPHPDDETIGCGATIARKRAAGTDVHVVVVADGRSSHPHSEVIGADELVSIRRGEVLEACRRLGVDTDHVVLLARPDESLAADRADMVDELAEILAQVDPDEVYVPSGRDWHPDHRALNAAARAALAGGPPRRLLEYPVWYWADGPWPSERPGSLGRVMGLVAEPLRASANERADLVATGEFLDRKVDALDAYRSQRTNLTGEATWATLPDGWFAPFVGPVEVFFPVADLDRPGGWRPRSGRLPGGGVRRLPTVGGPVRRVRDRFDDDRPKGHVIGSVGPRGALRRGVDAERRISIDHGALRIAPLATAGWGREGIAYGPFEPGAGLTFAAVVMDGHNTSRTDFRPEGRRARAARLLREAPQGRFDLAAPSFLDNLALGWFTTEAPEDALAEGHAVVMHAATVMNGELRVGVAGRPLAVDEGIQNLPITYAVVLREHGAIYFAGSLPGARGVGVGPRLRPLGLDPRPRSGPFFAGIHQSVLGEVGYRADTRVYGVDVQPVAELAEWCTTAVLADRFAGDGPIAESPMERGAGWEVLRGDPRRTTGGLAAPTGAEIRAPAVGELGLIHALLRPGSQPGTLAIGERGADGTCTWALRLDEGGAAVSWPGGSRRDEAPTARVVAGSEHSLQVLLEPGRVAVHLDGLACFDGWIELGARTSTDRRLFVELGPGTTVVADLEGHPASVSIDVAEQLPVPELPRSAATVVIADGFDGPFGDLDGRPVPGVETARWRRTFGLGTFVLSGEGELVVDADRRRPCPGRTLYTVAWPDPTFAEIEIEAVPPGSGRGEGENGRGGLVFWQDPDNHLIVNPWVDDYEEHDGSSISSFLRAGGREDMYDAIWSNVGRAVQWGAPYRLRVAFDGVHYMAWLNDEPVLYRAVTDIYPAAAPLRIVRVGLAANWEWGDDTGTVFRSFAGRQ